METLIVRQSNKNGTVKSARLKYEPHPQTFGSSRLSDVISVSPQIKGVQGFFEYRNGHWWYIDLDMDNSCQSNLSPEVRIDTQTSITVGDCKLELIPIKFKENIFELIENKQFELNAGRNFQLFIVRQGKKVLEAKVLPLNKNFRPQNSESKIKPVIGENWHSEVYGGLEIRQKTIALEDAQKWAHLTPDQIIDEDSKKGISIVFGAALFILTVNIFAPKSQSLQTVAAPPKIAQKILVKTEIKQKRQKIQEISMTPPMAEPQPVVVPPAPNQEPTPAATPQKNPTNSANTSKAGQGKVSQLLKSISGGRVSQILGKVASSDAKSQNLFVANGKKAGTNESGRALAGLGPIEKSGRDWGSESGGTKVVISTAGRGGGQTASHIGGLLAGKTGNSGVGLIEEEGEITGGLDREVIAQYIRSKLGQILYCYERQLSAEPDLFGKVAVKFTIVASGAVEQQVINDTTLKNANVEGCILNKIANWKFPKPEGGTKVVVTYPFLFKSTN